MIEQFPMPFPSKLIEKLAQASRVAALTGAGVSAESGIPTFREAQTGLWAQYDPVELATPRAFRRNPELVWDWYTWRRELISGASPNPGHEALVQLEQQFSEFTLITQNIDNLHAEAGSENIIEMHGNIFRNRCFEEDIEIKDWTDTGEIPPRCPKCGGYLRPDVVWFNESLPQDALEGAFNAAQNAQVFLSVGTSSLVQPAASLPLVAREGGSFVVEINPNETPISTRVDYQLRGPAGAVLPKLLAEFEKYQLY